MYLIKEKTRINHTYPRGCSIYLSNELVDWEELGDSGSDWDGFGKSGRYREDRGEAGSAEVRGLQVITTSPDIRSIGSVE